MDGDFCFFSAMIEKYVFEYKFSNTLEKYNWLSGWIKPEFCCFQFV